MSKCAECGTGFEAKRVEQAFCGAKCRNKFNNRRKQLGAVALDSALRWRRYRKKGDFTEFMRVVDMILREDRKAGRNRYQRPPVHMTAVQF